MELVSSKSAGAKMANDGLVNFLDFLAESQSRTVKALAKEFGDLVVYCRSQKFHVDDDKAKRIAAILNSSLFENKVDVPVVCASLAQINSNRQSDSAEFDLLSNQFFALTSSLYDFNVDGMHVEKLS